MEDDDPVPGVALEPGTEDPLATRAHRPGHGPAERPSTAHDGEPGSDPGGTRRLRCETRHPSDRARHLARTHEAHRDGVQAVADEPADDGAHRDCDQDARGQPERAVLPAPSGLALR